MSTANLSAASMRQGSRGRWAKDVQDLVSQVQLWATQQGWTTDVQETTVTENGAGTYTVPVLTAQAPGGQIIVEPIALRTPEFDGRVDLYAYPSLARMLLLRDVDGQQTRWVVRTSDDLDWPQPWGAETFAYIAKGLLRNP